MNVQLVRRALAVLTRLGEEPELTMQQLSTDLDVPMPSMHRLLSTLADEEYVVRSERRAYALGPAALALARGTRRLEDVARPEMRELADVVGGETVFLTTLVGRRAVCTAIVEGSRALRLTVTVGQSMPLHAAASARTILAHQPYEVVADLLSTPLTRYTERTPATAAEVFDHLDRVRRVGYDICRDELDPGVLAVSAPITLPTGQVGASVTVAAPAERHDGVDETWGALLIQTANRISRGMGATPAGGADPLTA